MEYTEYAKCTNMRQVAEDFGFDVNKSGKMLCPFHEEKTPSMQLYDDHFHCYGCGAHGSIVGFVAMLRGTDMYTAAQEVRDKYCRGIYDGTPPASCLQKLEKARQKQEVEHFSHSLISFCKIREEELETKHHSVMDAIKIRTEVEQVDAVLEMLARTEYNKKYDFVKEHIDVLKLCEKVISDNKGKEKKGKEEI